MAMIVGQLAQRCKYFVKYSYGAGAALTVAFRHATANCAFSHCGIEFAPRSPLPLGEGEGRGCMTHRASGATVSVSGRLFLVGPTQGVALHPLVRAAPSGRGRA